jgi:hypothetical protein
MKEMKSMRYKELKTANDRLINFLEENAVQPDRISGKTAIYNYTTQLSELLDRWFIITQIF